MGDISHIEMLQMISADFPTLANQIASVIGAKFNTEINNFEQNITNTIYDYAEPVVIAILCILVFQVLLLLIIIVIVSVICFRMKQKSQKEIIAPINA